jgi:DNA-binding FadR family transcriptional regulator
MYPPTVSWMDADADERQQYVHSPKMAELVARDVRRRIVLRQLAVDESLPPEPDLMAQYGVSRNVVREALRILESESMIELRRGARGGAKVHAPEARVAARYFGLLLQWRGATLGDVVHARVLLESAAVREMTLMSPNESTLTALRQLIDTAALGVGDFGNFGALAWSFSRALVESTGNKTVVLQHELIEDMISAHVARVEARMQTNPAPGVRANTLAVRAMQRVLQLVELGDERAAEDYWRAHLIAVSTTLANGVDSTAVVDLVQPGAPPGER